MRSAGTAVSDLVSHYEKLVRINTNLTTVSESFGDALTRSIKTPSERLPELVTQLDMMKENLSKQGADVTWIDKLKDKLNAVKDGPADQVAAAMREVKAEIDKTSDSVTIGADTAFSILSSKLGISETKLRALADSCELSEVQVIKLA